MSVGTIMFALLSKSFTMNIVEDIISTLGITKLQKVDPNTQEVKEGTDGGHSIEQAAVPAVLTALYKLMHTPDGATMVRRGKPSTGWTNLLFGSDTNRAVKRIADYASADRDKTQQVMEQVADESVRWVEEHAKGDLSVAKQLVQDQRPNILVYLPGSLQIGNLLEDSTLDDRTNKMTGPVSGLMHSIEKKFSGGEGNEPES